MLHGIGTHVIADPIDVPGRGVDLYEGIDALARRAPKLESALLTTEVF
jgi:hypothetical protein